MTLVEVDTLESFSYSTNSTELVLSSLHPAFTYTFSVAASTVEVGPSSPGVNITLPEDGKLNPSH